jgi:hypothetical protein
VSNDEPCGVHRRGAFAHDRLGAIVECARRFVEENQATCMAPPGRARNADQFAPINIPIYYYNSGIWDGVTLTEQQAAEVLAGRWYVNVMTMQYPEGEIRGQILPARK